MTKEKLHIYIRGEGPALVLLHGWGVNSAVFAPLYPVLREYKVYYVDLPGFGFSQPVYGDIKDWAALLANNLPDNAIWLGWSLGGLIATQVALDFPDKVKGLITVTSSPCFIAQKTDNWPGIAPQVLTEFQRQLTQDLPQTLDRFLAIQSMGSISAKEDIKQLRQLLLAKPLPDKQTLAQGLQMLSEVDLRKKVTSLTLPWLRIWGRLDGLVPKRVIPHMPVSVNTHDLVIAKASHAPFISHTDEFVQGLNNWLEQL